MLNLELISNPGAPLQTADDVASALELMEELRVNYWPVVEEGIFKGLVGEDILLSVNESVLLGTLMYDLLPFSVSGNEHFLSSVRLMTERKVDVIAVTELNREYLGLIVQSDLLQQLALYTGTNMPGGMVVLEMNPTDLSTGELSRLVETNNAQITQLNTRINEHTGTLSVSIRINRQEISDIIATLQRYDYKVAYFAGEEQYENELKRNYHHLLHFLEM